jgi:hypothetical protein
MEPTEDSLDRQLREAIPYIEDDGFTARVVQKLPPAKGRRRSLRSVILIGSSALASGAAYILSDGGRSVVVELSRLAAGSIWWVFGIALASGIAVMAGGLAAAMAKPGQLQP